MNRWHCKWILPISACCPECQNKRRQIKREYSRSPKQKEYRRTQKYRDRQRRYRSTPQAVERARRYNREYRI